MISLEKAKLLKEKLGWLPDIGDLYWREECNSDMIYCGADPDEDDVWLPRLDQLLAEIKKRGWAWTLHCDNDGSEIEIETYNPEIAPHLQYKCIEADTPEDAAAGALLYLISIEKR